MGNKSLHLAKKNKKDEFYTLYSTIEDEMKYYTQHFNGKIVYCNCDDYRWSNFVKYFKDNFIKLGLKKLIATNYNIGDGAYKYEYDGTEVVTALNGDGSYDSAECTKILSEADIVVTNPPFSCWRAYVKHLYGKAEFIILGCLNALTTKEVFPLIKDGKLKLGSTNRSNLFRVPDGYKFSSEDENGKYGRVVTTWYSTLDSTYQRPKFTPTAKYDPAIHKPYDNYCAINCDRIKDIFVDEYVIIDIPDDQYDKWKAVYGDDLEIYEG